MRMTRVFATMLVAVVAVTILGTSAEAQQLAKSGKYSGKYLFTANVLKNREVEKDHFFYLAENEGIFMNDAGEGFLHGSSSICPVFGVITKAGFAGNGTCVLTDTDGDKAFLAWNCALNPGGNCAGPFQWTGGTGKYQGLKGNNSFIAHGFIDGTNQEIVDWKGEWQLP
jgi:hypothetical protein